MNDAFGTALKLLHALEAGRQSGRTTATVTAAKLCGGVVIMPTPAMAAALSRSQGVHTRALPDLDRFFHDRRPVILDHTTVETLLQNMLAEHRRVILSIQEGRPSVPAWTPLDQRQLDHELRRGQPAPEWKP